MLVPASVFDWVRMLFVLSFWSIFRCCYDAFSPEYTPLGRLDGVSADSSSDLHWVPSESDFWIIFICPALPRDYIRHVTDWVLDSEGTWRDVCVGRRRVGETVASLGKSRFAWTFWCWRITYSICPLIRGILLSAPRHQVHSSCHALRKVHVVVFGSCPFLHSLWPSLVYFDPWLFLCRPGQRDVISHWPMLGRVTGRLAKYLGLQFSRVPPFDVLRVGSVFVGYVTILFLSSCF